MKSYFRDIYRLRAYFQIQALSYLILLAYKKAQENDPIPPTCSPPPNVPYANAEPYEVALIDTSAYVANYGLGVQAVNLVQVVEPYLSQTDTNKAWEEAQANSIGGTATGSSFMSVSRVGNNILAVQNSMLTVLDPSLSVIGQFTGLNYPFSVTGVEKFPIDIDNDRNYGEAEDNDGDSTTSAQESFDLALVSTSDGIVVIDVTNPTAPSKMDIIPIKVGKLAVNRERRMAFGLGGGLVAISLKDLRPPTNPSNVGGLIDKDGDENDDRLLYTIPDAGGMDMKKEVKGQTFILHLKTMITNIRNIYHLKTYIEIQRIMKVLGYIDLSKSRSAVCLFPVQHTVDGYGFRLVVNFVEDTIFSDSKTVSIDTFKFLGLLLPRLRSQGFDFFVKDGEVFRTNRAKVLFNRGLGKESVHQRRLDFFKCDSIFEYGTDVSWTTDRKAFLSSISSRAWRSFLYSLRSRITAFFLPFSSVIY